MTALRAAEDFVERASGSPEGSSKVQSSGAISTFPLMLVNAVRHQPLRVMFRSRAFLGQCHAPPSFRARAGRFAQLHIKAEGGH